MEPGRGTHRAGKAPGAAGSCYSLQFRGQEAGPRTGGGCGHGRRAVPPGAEATEWSAMTPVPACPPLSFLPSISHWVSPPGSQRAGEVEVGSLDGVQPLYTGRGRKGSWDNQQLTSRNSEGSKRILPGAVGSSGAPVPCQVASHLSLPAPFLCSPPPSFPPLPLFPLLPLFSPLPFFFIPSPPSLVSFKDPI